MSFTNNFPFYYDMIVPTSCSRNCVIGIPIDIYRPEEALRAFGVNRLDFLPNVYQKDPLSRRCAIFPEQVDWDKLMNAGLQLFDGIAKCSRT